MSEDSVPCMDTGRPDSAVSTAVTETDNSRGRCNENCATCGGLNCDVHSDDAIEADGSSLADLDVHYNANCDVHSTAGNRNWNAQFIDGLYGSAAIVPTQETYTQLQAAYDFLNRQLFENKLPNCLITLQRRKGTYGYFAAGRFGREDGQRTDEIALNPQHFAKRTIEENLSTLAHEMKHLEQHRLGTAGRPGYHNKDWADRMEAIGLIPSDTGREGGKRTGDKVSHYIKPGGMFAVSVEKLLATGFKLTWREMTALKDGSRARVGSPSGQRTKFTCPDCGDNAWGKGDLHLVCGRHGKKMVPVNSSRDTP